MTAIRVVTDHKELNNSGQYTHSELDGYVSSGPFLFVSGASGQITPSARRLKAGPGVIIDDEGPGGYLTITATVTASSGGSSSGSGTYVGAANQWNEIPSGSNNGINKIFSLASNPYPPASLMLFVNGVKQRQGPDSDYTLSNNVITLITDYRSGSNIDATYATFTTIQWNEVPSGSNDGVNNIFSLYASPSPPSSLMLFINGVKQRQGVGNDYTLSGSVISLLTTYRSGSNIDAIYPY